VGAWGESPAPPLPNTLATQPVPDPHFAPIPYQEHGNFQLLDLPAETLDMQPSDRLIGLGQLDMDIAGEAGVGIGK
jgi:hypothetical protein